MTVEIVNNSQRVVIRFTDHVLVYIPLNDHELKALGLTNDLASNRVYAWKITVKQ